MCVQSAVVLGASKPMIVTLWLLHCRSLPAVVKGRGRPAFDAIAQPLKAALNRLDTEAQVRVRTGRSEQCMHTAHVAGRQQF
jgi:hypothetical protein